MLVCMLNRFSHVQLFATLWTKAHQAPLPMGFSRQEYWSGLPFSSSGDLPDPGIDLTSLMSPALAGRFFTTSTTWEAPQRRKHPYQWRFPLQIKFKREQQFTIILSSVTSFLSWSTSIFNLSFSVRSSILITGIFCLLKK